MGSSDPATPDSSLPSDNLANKRPLNKYRVRHQREDGEHVPVLLQNRIVEAESAERALRVIIGDRSIPIETTNEFAAIATRKNGTLIESWEAECEDAL